MNANEAIENAKWLAIEIPAREWVNGEIKNIATDIAEFIEKQRIELSVHKVLNEGQANLIRQQQAEIEQWGVEFDELTNDFMKQQAEIEALKAKTLTDEEINECWERFMGTDDYTRIDIARAILRKVQEK